MSDIKIDLTLKDLDVQTAAVIVAYLGGKSPAATMRAEGESVKAPAEKEAPEKESPKKSAKKGKGKAKAKPEPEPDEAEEEDDDWDDDNEEEASEGDDASKYADIKKWRELATALVGDGYNTAPKLLAKCKSLQGKVAALEKIPDDNLVIRCDRAIEVLGA